MNVEETDVVVVGAGPIGLEMAIALKRAGIDYLQFDARQIGYTVSWFAPQTRFFSSNERIAIAGVPLQSDDQNKSTREHYLAYLRGIVQEFGLRVRTYEPVVGIARQDDGRLLVTTRPASREKRCIARHIVLATGGTDRPRLLNIPGEDLPHVTHYFTDPHLYFGRKLLVVGGRNSAAEAALRCHYAGAKVTISYRRPVLDKGIKYWILPELNNLIETGHVTAMFNTLPTRIDATSVTLGRCEADTCRLIDGTDRQVDADFVLLLTGYQADLSLLRLAGVELRGSCDAPVFDPQTMKTSVPGVYVAGTAVAGTQEKYQVFIENCHVHVARILADLTHTAPPPAPVPLARPES